MNYYAGVGSTETPAHIQDIEHHIAAYLAGQGWKLRSGHASGSDDAFEKGVDTYMNLLADHEPFVDDIKFKESYLPWLGYNRPNMRSSSFISPDKHPFTQGEKETAAANHPAWNKCSPSARLMHQRNVRIMMGIEALHGENVIPVKFVVCWTEKGVITGGTGQALRMAKVLDIPIINLGLAQNPTELEELILRVDEYQIKLKDK